MGGAYVSAIVVVFVGMLWDDLAPGRCVRRWLLVVAVVVVLRVVLMHAFL
jgi:hypothetical protein